MLRPHLLITAVLSIAFAAAQAPPDKQAGSGSLQEVQDFQAWLKDYHIGAIRLAKDGAIDQAALDQVEHRMQLLAQANTLVAAKLLFAAASTLPQSAKAINSTERIDFYRELQPWRVQMAAAKALRTMTTGGLMPWLLGMLDSKNLRGKDGAQDQLNATAVLRVLAGHTSLEARLALAKASQSMPPELRVRAVMALSEHPSLDEATLLIDLLKDAEPSVRIAAADGVGAALQPFVDESLGKTPDAATLLLRDQAIAKLTGLLVRDAVWQVRTAAAYAIAGMKCKASVPAIIEGLKAELGRKQDPWAMDLRLHRILEGLTGQTVTPGDIRPWEDFWQKEGPGFTVAKQGTPIAKQSTPSKYGKFFNLQIETDRVLFVVDFSGSMAETIELKTRTTGVAAGQQTTKANLVVQELKKLIQSLPDGTLFNIIVFSDEVRVWREDHGRPALVKLADETRDDLLGNFLDSLRPSGGTNLYGGLAKALEFGGRGVYDKYYAAAFDTLYVITDGAPSCGEVTDKEEIRRRVREANRLRKITLHCITFGNKNDTDFLGPLAEENGGRHIHID
ncbi:MAG: HEAT repeat domain-containing protein [Planctomycetota bacterium]|nr:HEAT repeat domain-containing protein [Planctomycetota bacterium]